MKNSAQNLVLQAVVADDDFHCQIYDYDERVKRETKMKNCCSSVSDFCLLLDYASDQICKFIMIDYFKMSFTFDCPF